MLVMNENMLNPIDVSDTQVASDVKHSMKLYDIIVIECGEHSRVGAAREKTFAWAIRRKESTKDGIHKKAEIVGLMQIDEDKEYPYTDPDKAREAGRAQLILYLKFNSVINSHIQVGF